MKSFDFEYDGIRLSDKGYIICKFDFDSVETVQNGSEITFNSIPTSNGIKHELTSAVYEDCLTATLQICKYPCTFGDLEEISIDDMRDIMRWLNRKQYHKFRLLDTEYSGIFFESSFNVSKIEINGKTLGFELEMFTNRPFGLQEQVVLNMDNIVPGENRRIISRSDEEGYIYPDMKIIIDSDGDFELRNEAENRTMKILNCRVGEVITVDYPIIKSTISSHKIQNDFNWIFFRISNTFRNKDNVISASLPCSITMKYYPIAKVGI